MKRTEVKSQESAKNYGKSAFLSTSDFFKRNTSQNEHNITTTKLEEKKNK